MSYKLANIQELRRNKSKNATSRFELLIEMISLLKAMYEQIEIIEGELLSFLNNMIVDELLEINDLNDQDSVLIKNISYK
jgi:uncharacterized membrane protein